jgi:ATP-dependent Lon protease
MPCAVSALVSRIIREMEQSPKGRGRAWASDAVARFAEGARDSLIDRYNRPKYHDAAEVALDVLTKHIEALDEKVESGAKIAQQDHYLHKKLRDIKSELEQALEELAENPDRG